MKFYEVQWSEGLAGSIRQFATTLAGVKEIKAKANQRNETPRDYFIVTKVSFRNPSELCEWLNKHARSAECCGDE